MQKFVVLDLILVFGFISCFVFRQNFPFLINFINGFFVKT